MTRLHRWWLPALFTSALAFAACGGDDDTTTPTDSGVDAGAKDGSTPTDSGTPTDAGTMVKVSNPLTSCTSASTCTGSAATCSPALTFGPSAAPVTVPYPGGSVCTATCASSAECGTGGACPVGDLLKILPAASALVGSTGYCSKSCTLGVNSTCPTGFACLNLKILGMQLAPDAGASVDLPVLNQPFCIPVAGDAGTSPSFVGGMDAGL